MKPIRIGVVGTGKIARDQHVPVLMADPGFALAASASPEGGIAGIAHFPDLDAMLEATPGLDAVAICTPPQVRFDLARKALLAGKHVLLEKPPCSTLSQFAILQDLARAENRTLFQAWHSRFAPGVPKAAEFLAAHAPTGGRIVWKEDVRQWHPGQPWLWQKGGCGVFDPGINAISILTRILPEPVFVAEAELLVPANCEAPIAADLRFATASGLAIPAVFDFRHAGIQTWDIEIETGAGLLKLAAGGAALAIGGKDVVLGGEAGLHAEYAPLYRHFAALIREGRSDADVGPFRLVADAFLAGRRCLIEDFEE